MNIVCQACENEQEYHPMNNKIPQNPSTKCKCCGAHIRVSKKLISIVDFEVKTENFLLFHYIQTLLNYQFSLSPASPLFEEGITVFDLGDNYKINFEVFPRLREFNGVSIIYGFFRKQMFSKLHHIEFGMSNKTNTISSITFLFNKPKEDIKFRDYLIDCKGLAGDIIENVINKLGYGIDSITGRKYLLDKNSLGLLNF